MTAIAIEAKQTPSVQLAGTFAKWLNKFSLDKEVRGEDLFKVIDHQFIVDLDRASRVSRSGVRADGIEDLVPLLGLSGKEAAAHVLGASSVSLWRWARDKKPLPEVHTEQIIRAMELQLMAADVFGSAEQAQKWLTRPHPSLQGEAPLSYASNEYGAQKVRGMLAALRYGGVA